MVGRRNSIRTLLAVLLGSLLIPLVALLTYSQVRSVLNRVEQDRERLHTLATTASAGIRQFVLNTERVLESLAQNPDVRSMDPNRCDAFSTLKDIFLPTYTNVFTWTVDGVEICSAMASSAGSGIPGSPQGGQSVGTPPGFQEIVAAQDFHISRVHLGTASGRWTTGLSYPLRDDNGNKVGVITASVDLIQFQEILERLEPVGDGIVSLIEQESGIFVARSRNPEELVGTSSDPYDARSPHDPDFSDQGFSVSRTVEGEEYFWGFVRVQDTPWQVYAGLPVEAVRPSFLRWAVLSSGGILLILSIAVFLGVWAYRRITRPLNRLVEETSRAKPGDPAPLSESGPEEIALLAGRFNQAWAAWEEAKAQRRQSMDRIRSLVANAVTGIYVSTQAGRFLEVNHAMVDLLGYDSREELLNTPVHALYNSEEERLEVLAAHGRKEFFRGVEVEWRKKDGTPLTVRLFGRRFQSQAGEVSWEVIVEDVTQLRQLQDQYLQSQKMEALGRMAGGVAHDFNNLLTVIQGQSELILDDPRVGEDVKAQVRDIAEAATHGAQLNRQLLAFGRRGREKRETLDLNAIVRGFELVLRRAAGEEVDVQFSLSSDVGWMEGDRSQLEQVLMNLVVNARDAMPGGGSLLVETYNVELDEEEARTFHPALPGAHVVLAVSDTGTGIDAEVQPRIFEPFFSTKPEAEGTGLGLATVYGIVAELGGHIRLESEEGEGTTFRLFFPRQTPGKAGKDSLPEAMGNREGSGRILLAEDEDGVRRLTQVILQRAGYEVISAADGEEALALARGDEEGLDLLLSDVVMPGVRGPELARTLAGEGIIRRVVLFSGYPEGLKGTDLEGVDAWELLPKPFTSAGLLNVVERVLKPER